MQIVGNARIPIVVAKIAQEGLFQLFLSICIEGIFGMFAIDEHGIIPLRHAEQNDDAIPARSRAQLLVVVDLGGDCIDVARSITGIVIHDDKIDSHLMAFGKGFGFGF